MSNYPYVDMIRTKTHADGMLPVHIIVKNRKAEKRKVDINDFGGRFKGGEASRQAWRRKTRIIYKLYIIYILLYYNIIIKTIIKTITKKSPLSAFRKCLMSTFRISSFLLSKRQGNASINALKYFRK